MEPPEGFLERLRQVSRVADFIWNPFRDCWSLGEVRPNKTRERLSCAAIRKYQEACEVKHQRRNAELLWEQDLRRQGWSWIRDYHGPPTGRIVEDYRRMCWKEHHGVLDREFRVQLDASDDGVQLARKKMRMQEILEYSVKSAHNYSFRGRRTFLQGRLAASGR